MLIGKMLLSNTVFGLIPCLLSITVQCSPDYHGSIPLSRRSAEESRPFRKWNALAIKRMALLEALSLVDQDIGTTISDIRRGTANAHFDVQKTAKLSNVRAFTYGITTILAMYYLTEYALDGVDVTEITTAHTLVIAGNAGFAYGVASSVQGQLNQEDRSIFIPAFHKEPLATLTQGGRERDFKPDPISFLFGYGGPYLDGQLTNGDPGCGVKDLVGTLDPIRELQTLYIALVDADGTQNPLDLIQDDPLPSMIRLEIKDRLDQTRLALFCLLSQSGSSTEAAKLENRINTLEAAFNARLDIVEALITNLQEENEQAQELGHGPFALQSPAWSLR